MEPLLPPPRDPYDQLRDMPSEEIRAAAERMRQPLVEMLARRRADAIERCMWRMISHGQLFSQGWRVCVVDHEDRFGPTGGCDVFPLAPDQTPPGRCSLMTLSADHYGRR